MELKGRNIVVVGLARSGMAVSRFLNARGARVTITDQAPESSLVPYPAEARELNIDLELGGHGTQSFQNADLIVISPGVPHMLPMLMDACERGIEVIGELELAARFIRAPIVAVSGTNGKTTTTELLGQMLTASGKKIFVGGNIGNPLIDIAGKDDGMDAVVAEVSSFQLDTIKSFRPRIAVLLNITPDHLDRYPDLEAYGRSKGRLFENQGSEDFAVCHGNDPLVQNYCRTARSRMLYFYSRPSSDRSAGEGAIITPRQIVVSIPGLIQGRINLQHTALIGPHNRENIAAAALAALAAGGTLQGVQTALDGFKVPAHRIEIVRTVKDILFVNDSKATNVDAVIRALECFDEPVVLIMGGRNKGYDFTALWDHVKKHVRKLVVIGEAADAIVAAIGRAPDQGAEKAADLEKAVQKAYEAARAGDVVLLSPACASFDMFTSYAERGEKFRQLVKGLR